MVIKVISKPQCLLAPQDGSETAGIDMEQKHAATPYYIDIFEPEIAGGAV